MSIFKIAPTEKESERWRASTYKGDVIVRAENEDEARIKEAQLKFANPTIITGPGQMTLRSPWIDLELVSCERLENSKYEENGPAGVLYPED